MKCSPTPSPRCSSTKSRCCSPTSLTASIPSTPSCTTSPARRLRSTRRCASTSPTTARPAGAIVIANPNAPTGIALPIEDVAALVDEHRDIPVVVDEAYVDFGGESALTLLDGRPNLLVVRTMSKSRALAGLRVGYAIGDAGLIEALIRVKDSFNSYPLGRPAQAGAIASVRDEAYFQARRADVLAPAQDHGGVLAKLGFEVLPSVRQFCFCPPRGVPRRGMDEAAARARRAGAPFQQAAHRRLFAHHGGDGRRDFSADRGVQGDFGRVIEPWARRLRLANPVSVRRGRTTSYDGGGTFEAYPSAYTPSRRGPLGQPDVALRRARASRTS